MRNLNCMYRLPRQLSDRKGRYQLGRKKERKTINDFPQPKKNLLTCAERYGSSFGGAEQARIDAGELAIDDAIQLRVTRCCFAEWRRGHDAAVVQCVARVLAVRDGVVDQRLLVVDPGQLGKVDHRVNAVLLLTRVRAREERVDPVDPGQHHAGVVVRVPLSAARHAEVLPALGDLSEVGLGDSLEEQGRF